LTINNSIIVQNSLSDISSSGTIRGNNNLTTFTGWSSGAANLVYDSAKPLFTNAAKGDYRLSENSQAIDKGKNAFVPAWLTTDLAGNSRIINGTVDIGAYEYDGAFAPANFRSISQTANSVTLEWTAQDNLTGYTLEYKKSTDSKWTTWTPAPGSSASSATITDLTANTAYIFRLTATNASGSAFSETSATTPPIPIQASLDLDGDGVVDERDANLLLLYTFGFHEGNSGWANNLLRSSTGTRNTGAQVLEYLNTNKTTFDLDGDGVVDERDANLLLLYTFGFHEGNSGWANNLLRSSTGTRNTGSQVLAYITSVLPGSSVASAMPNLAVAPAAPVADLFTGSSVVDLSTNTIAGIDLLDGQKRMESKEQELSNAMVSDDLSEVFADYENWIYEESDDQIDWNGDLMANGMRLTALDLVLSN